MPSGSPCGLVLVFAAVACDSGANVPAPAPSPRSGPSGPVPISAETIEIDVGGEPIGIAAGEGYRGPIGTPCPEPDGGWASPAASPDLSMATEDDMLATMHAAEEEPDFSGFWIDYVEEPVGEKIIEPGGIIANVAFTGDLDRHIAQIRETWGGPLCVVEFERTYHELRRIQDGFVVDIGGELGLQMTWSSGDVTRNRVEIGVVVATEEARRAVDERYGEGAVLLVPALTPVA